MTESGASEAGAGVGGALDGRRILASAAEIAYPRFPGTEGDRRAIDHLARRFAELGLAVEREPFSYDLRPAWLALRAALLLGATALAVSGWTLPERPGIAAFVLAAGALPGLVFLGWAPLLERVYRREGATRTANVVARRPAAGARRSTLVLLAHHDSKSQNLTLPFRLGFTLVALAGLLVLVVLLVRALAFGVDAAPTVSRAVGWSGAAALFALSFLRNGDRSPGGVDNAGSVGILLALARTLPDEVAPEVELVFLSPGAEEDHMVGAMRWLDRHADELGRYPVTAINLDGAGAPGRLVLLERYGFGRLFAPELSRLAREEAAAMGERPRGVFLPPGMGLDSIPFAHRGIPCLTLSSGSLGPAAWNVHSAGDTADLLDAATLGRAAELAHRLAVAVSAPPSV